MQITSDMVAKSIDMNWKTAQNTGYSSEWFHISTMLQGIWMLAFETRANSEVLDNITFLQDIASTYRTS